MNDNNWTEALRNAMYQFYFKTGRSRYSLNTDFSSDLHFDITTKKMNKTQILAMQQLVLTFE